MGKRGTHPKGKIKIEWSEDFAYAIGLIASGGCLYNDGRHINLTSKDREQISNFQDSLGINLHVGRKGNGASSEKKYYLVQIGDVLFFNFLVNIGITPAKSKTLGGIKIPREYFFDFLRGSFDGDGCTFVSASQPHVIWLRGEIERELGLIGYVTKAKNNSCYQLRYAKRESVILLREMYYSSNVRCLSRKKLKIKRMLAIVGKSLE